MHELAICQSVIDQVARIAAEHHARSVGVIRLRIGPLAGVEPELLAQAFPLAAAGTPAEHAVLETEIIPIRVRCRRCGAESEATVNSLICSACGDWKTQILSGDEMLLASVELETVEEPDHV